MPNKNTAEVKALAMRSAPDAIKELAHIMRHGETHAVQVSAAREILDRAIGKAVQPMSGEAGEGPVVIRVATGVPRALE